MNSKARSYTIGDGLTIITKRASSALPANPESKENAKDLLAEYILGLVNFNIELVDKENNNLDNSAVFNLTYDR